MKQLSILEENVRSYDRSRRTTAVGSCAPAPVWDVLPYLNYADPCMAVFSEISTTEKLVQGLLEGRYQLVIVDGIPEEPGLYWEKYSEEQSFFLLPETHPLAGRELLSFEDFDGDTMLVYEEIGLWEQVYRRHLPNTHVIIEKNWSSFQKLIDTSALPVFITDLALKHFKFPPGKIPAAISDKDSKKSYYCVCLKSQRSKWTPFFDRIKTLT